MGCVLVPPAVGALLPLTMEVCSASAWSACCSMYSIVDLSLYFRNPTQRNPRKANPTTPPMEDPTAIFHVFEFFLAGGLGVKFGDPEGGEATIGGGGPENCGIGAGMGTGAGAKD